MAGHTISLYLKEQGHDVYGFDPQDLYEMGTTIGYDNSIVVDKKQVVAEP